MSGGVAAGATSICQAAASKPGTPASAMVGMSFTAGMRSLVEMPSERTLPASICAMPGARSQNIRSMWPATTSLSAGSVPL